MNYTFEIGDDSGMIGIVNNDTYNAFISDDWTYEQIMDRFLSEMNNNNLIIWKTNYESMWNVHITDKQTNSNKSNSFICQLTVTNQKLYLINYEDLSMAAQFEDVKIPSRIGSHLGFELENGNYQVQICRLIDAECHYEVIFEKIIEYSSNQILSDIPTVYL